MVQMTIQVSDELAQRCKSIGPWLSTIIELSLTGFKTQAVAAVTEIIDFLCKNPDPDEITDFHVSESAQSRLRRLLALNEADCLSLSEKAELDELQRLEHIIIMLKINAAKLLHRE
ncbi:Uncharacterized protein dnl_16280 [Desulfonema limicola]|uniref:Uncharacterized protein n=1 Tax=Desulfonema limicola TaxID=45656 RepID=A0A975GFJ5_9BACT|nr:hypothetical protein [Desulfonema limicola]QTA79361.1 Uncharacterized protein dnl_16280 [Desulfonema limicola]